MKRAGIFCIVLLWIAAGVQLVYGKTGEVDKVAQVLAQVGSQEQSCTVEYYGVYNKDYLELEQREEFLHEIAEGLGIRDGMKVTRTYDGDREETKLVKEARRAATTLRMITLNKDGEEPVQYLIGNIRMEGTMENALAYREKLKELLKKDTRSQKSSANVIGSYQGKLSLEERDQIADGLLEKMGAHVVSEHRDMRLYTIYGYTPYVKEYELQEDDAVNINIAMYYSQAEDETYIYAAIPVIGLDY